MVLLMQLWELEPCLCFQCFARGGTAAGAYTAPAAAAAAVALLLFVTLL